MLQLEVLKLQLVNEQKKVEILDDMKIVLNMLKERLQVFSEQLATNFNCKKSFLALLELWTSNCVAGGHAAHYGIDATRGVQFCAIPASYLVDLMHVFYFDDSIHFRHVKLRLFLASY